MMTTTTTTPTTTPSRYPYCGGPAYDTDPVLINSPSSWAAFQTTFLNDTMCNSLYGRLEITAWSFDASPEELNFPNLSNLTQGVVVFAQNVGALSTRLRLSFPDLEIIGCAGDPCAPQTMTVTAAGGVISALSMPHLHTITEDLILRAQTVDGVAGVIASATFGTELAAPAVLSVWRNIVLRSDSPLATVANVSMARMGSVGSLSIGSTGLVSNIALQASTQEVFSVAGVVAISGSGEVRTVTLGNLTKVRRHRVSSRVDYVYAVERGINGRNEPCSNWTHRCHAFPWIRADV